MGHGDMSGESRIALLGPAGTFSDEAAAKLGWPDGQRIHCANLVEAYERALADEQCRVLLPVENSLEGGVGTSLDLLHRGGPLTIQGEVVLAVQHCLLARAGATIESLRTVASHPHALAQCQGYLRRHLPNAATQPAASTAAGAALAAQTDGVGAIASVGAAARYGLAILAQGIQDGLRNWTRFVLLGRGVPASTGADRTSIVFTLRRDRPGALHEILGEFARRNLNLSRVESRPLRTVRGRYVFHVDLEAHRDDPLCAEALSVVSSHAETFQFLGSYPRDERWGEEQP